MAHFKLHALFRRNQYVSDICGWEVVRLSPTFKFDETTFLLTEEESFAFQNKYMKEPVDYSLIWIVQRPGGSVYDRLTAVKFYHPPSAVLFKLSRS